MYTHYYYPIYIYIHSLIQLCVCESSAVGLCQAEKVVVQKNDVKGGGDNATGDFDGREA